MARMRGAGGGTGAVVGLVLFVFLFVIATLLAIILYSKLSSYEARALTAESKLNEAASPSDLKTAQEIAAVPETGSTQPEKDTRAGKVKPVGKVVADLREAKHLLMGESEATLGQIRAKLADLEVPQTNSAVMEIVRLRNEKAASDQAKAQVENELKTAQVALAKAAEQQNAMRAGFDKAVASLTADRDALAAQAKAYEGQVDGQRTTLEKTLSDAQAKAQKEASDLRAQLEQKDQTVAELQKVIDEMKRKRPSTLTVDPTRQADGRIVTVLPNENLVYVNIGRKQHVVLGMTFEVFDGSTGVVNDPKAEFRGKSTVEVVNMDDSSATCRVVRLAKGKSLGEGDVIANVAYDPQSSLKFYVYGNFDLENTGQATPADRRRIETLIAQWGSQAAEQFSYDVDFLVLGQEPTMPASLKGTEIDPKLIAEYTAQKREYERYNELLVQAEKLRIPVLNQHRFLAQVGYYRR